MVDNFIGKICICKRGIKGIVLRKKKNCWIGKTLNGKNWQSKYPEIKEN